MTEVNSEAGLSRAHPQQILGITAAQPGVQNLRTCPVELPRAQDKVYTSNQALWNALISERVRATAIVKLENFWLSEWFPLRPGLFHTPQGYENRLRANQHRLTGPGVSDYGLRQFQDLFGRSVPPQMLERFQLRSSIVYDPYGKSFMLDGGVGCVRLKCKQISGGKAWFMGASSRPIAHEGVPVALPDDLYAEFIERIADDGSLRCTITGKLAQIPDDFDPLYRNLVGIPQVYILVEKLQLSRSTGNASFLSTGAVMIELRPNARAPEGARRLQDGVYGAYVSFFPRQPNAIRTAAEWLQEIYVHQLLDGRVITDFDEQVRRFSGTVFSLEHVMNGDISATDAEHLLAICRASQRVSHQFIEKIEVINGDSWNIVGDANIIASPGSAAASSGGAAASGMSAVATHGAMVIANHSSFEGSFVQRARESRWTMGFGVVALLATAIATILLILNVTDVGIAGYILAVIAIIVGVTPLFK